MSKSKPARLHLKRALYRSLAANRSFDLVRATCSFLEDNQITESHAVYIPLISSVCVLYSRPFTSNEGIGALPQKYGRFAESKLQVTHDSVLSSRNQLYAHCDTSYEVTDPQTGKSEPLHSLLVYVMHDPVPQGTLVRYYVGIPELNLRHVVTKDLVCVCDELQSRLNREIETLKQSLFSGRPGLPQGLHKFRLDDES
jgi:hypothetical protein